ncbi:MAG: lipopolysaccharide heptosyltransferase II [Planctomycetes bacterium]|nr:lipopolysaccharide heptosyltransferase II [Planctomycetota bacterium]
MKQVAIFLPNWVGDGVMATPTLRALRNFYGRNVRMIGIGRPAVVGVLEGTPWLNETWAFKSRSRGALPNRRKIIARLRREKIDTAILLPNSFTSAAMAWLSGARHRIGYARDGRTLLLTKKLRAPRSGKKWLPISAVDYYLGIAESLGALTLDKHMELVLTAQDRGLQQNLYSKWNWNPSAPTVVINNGGAYGGAKLWTAEHVRDLAKGLCETPQLQVLLHCGPDEREAANALETELANPRVRSMGTEENLPLGLTKAVLAKASVVISTDSGPRHIAVAFNKPVVSLFGPTDPAWTTTYNVRESYMEEKLPCRACWKRTCPLGHHRCMTDLKVERVLRETLLRLTESQLSEHQEGSSKTDIGESQTRAA